MSEVLCERLEVGIAVLRLNRPEARNALSLSLRKQLAEHLNTLDADADVRAVIVTGDRKVFAAGADLKLMAEQSPMSMHQLRLDRLWQTVAEFRKPLIAAINGYALGGCCELALHCDILIAGRDATSGLPEIKVGIMPGAGGTQRLVRIVGKHRALRVLLRGELFDAETAHAWGLVSELVEPDAVEETALDYARTISGLPARAVEFIKESVLQGADLPLSAALTLERKSLQLLFDIADQKEEMQAFLEKRKPQFKGE